MNPGDRPRLRAFTFVLGVLTMVIGAGLFIVPEVMKMGGEWILACLFIAGAVTTAGFAVTTLRLDVRAYCMLLSAISLVTGVIVLVHPLDTFITMTTLLGMYFILESALMGGLGTSLRHIFSVAVWPFLFSLLSFVISALIWLRLSGAPREVLLALVGISFVARGAMWIILSVMMKGRGPLAPSTVRGASSSAQSIS